jgi:hypothetical protein
MICPATFEFVIPKSGVAGRFLTKQTRNRTAIKTISFTPEDSDSSTDFLASLNQDFLNALLAASNRLVTVRARRSRGGTLQRIRKPSGGRGKGRLSKLPWNDPTVIARVVELMSEAEHGYRSGTHWELDTKLKREAWVARKTKTWSAGTVHLQLQIARNMGLLTTKGKRK